MSQTAWNWAAMIFLQVFIGAIYGVMIRRALGKDFSLLLLIAAMMYVSGLLFGYLRGQLLPSSTFLPFGVILFVAMSITFFWSSEKKKVR